MTYLEHITRKGERWDLLAYHYYGDALAYEQIIVANPLVAIRSALPSGIALRIPVLESVTSQKDLPPWLR